MTPKRYTKTVYLRMSDRNGGKEPITPRMSKKRRLEWSFFLNDRSRVTYNELCRRCRRDCKQSFRAVVIECPKYLSKRSRKGAEKRGKTEQSRKRQKSLWNKGRTSIHSLTTMYRASCGAAP